MMPFHLHYEALTSWLRLNPQWGGVIAFLIAFSESIPVIGSIIPGSVTMTAVGILIGAGILPLWITLLWAVAGAFMGDTSGYGVGYYFRDNIECIWPFSRYPNLLKSGQIFMQRHGGKSVFLGRFIGLIRAIIPIIAGMLALKPQKYFLASIPAAFLWAPFYMLPGMLIGAVSLQLPPELATELVIFLLMGLVSIWLLIKLIHVLYLKTHLYFEQLLHQQWLSWKNKPSRRWIVYLFRYEERGEQGQVPLALVGLFSLIGLGFLFLNVMIHTFLMNWNIMVYHLFRGLRMGLLDHVMVGITTLGDYRVIGPVCVIVALFLIARRYYWAAIHLFFVTVFTGGVGGLLKLLIFSPRPLGIIHVSETNSFPSTHIALATAFYGFITFLLATHFDKRIRIHIYTGVSCLVLAIGVSRLYLSMHWLTDVIAGLFLGISLLSAAIISYQRYSTKPIPFKSLLGVSLASIIIVFSFVFYHRLPIDLQNSKLFWKEYIISEESWWNHHVPLLPLYRIDRLGHPKELLNLQWAGRLQEIKNSLEKKGWRILYSSQEQKTSLEELKASKAELAHYRTLFPRLYNDEKPVLEMIKWGKPKELPFILRLWPSHIYLSVQQLPLWVGTLYYQKINKQLIFIHPKIYLPSHKEIYDRLKMDIDFRQWVFKTHLISSLLNKKVNGQSIRESEAIILIKPHEII